MAAPSLRRVLSVAVYKPPLSTAAHCSLAAVDALVMAVSRSAARACRGDGVSASGALAASLAHCSLLLLLQGSLRSLDPSLAQP